jgi:hypothetical protein
MCMMLEPRQSRLLAVQSVWIDFGTYQDHWLNQCLSNAKESIRSS